MLPRVAIVMLNWNSFQDTLECVESLQTLTYQNFFVVVVDNGSEKDDADKIERTFGSFVSLVRNTRNLGYAGGCNVGLRCGFKMGADYIFLINNDMVLARDCLTKLVEVAQADPSIGVVMPTEYSYEERTTKRFPTGIYQLSPLFHLMLQPLAPMINRVLRLSSEGITELRVMETGMALMRSSIFAEVGLFDPVYFFGGAENLELSIAVARLGLRMYVVPQASLWHKGAASIGGYRKGLRRNTYCGVKNRLIFVRKNLRGFWKISSLGILLFIHSPLIMLHRLIVIRQPRTAWAVITGIRDGFATDLANRAVLA